MMTEAEAKKKWCSHARTLDYILDVARIGDDGQFVFAAVNRRPADYDRDGNETVEITGRHRCIASECMAWRWVPDRTSTASKYLADSGEGWNVVKERDGIIDWEKPGTVFGYCGLAGKP